MVIEITYCEVATPAPCAWDVRYGGMKHALKRVLVMTCARGGVGPSFVHPTLTLVIARVVPCRWVGWWLDV
jgi:hypothetical protein